MKALTEAICYSNYSLVALDYKNNGKWYCLSVLFNVWFDDILLLSSNCSVLKSTVDEDWILLRGRFMVNCDGGKSGDKASSAKIVKYSSVFMNEYSESIESSSL